MTGRQSSVCIDASLALSWLFYDNCREQSDYLWKKWRQDAVTMVAPPMFHAEVTSVIRRNVYFSNILPEEGERLFNVLTRLPVNVINSRYVYRGAWQLARDYNFPVCYDMQYLAVAELEDCEFWTLDRKLINAVGDRNRRIRWVGGIHE